MIPPRHRPYFETQQRPQRDEAALYHYDLTYHGVSFVERHLFYRGRRDVEDDGLGDKCREFSVGRPDRGEFYSPNYPSNYPNHTECIKLLEGK